MTLANVQQVPTTVNLAAILAEVFPVNLPPSRLRHNPPPQRGDVVDTLHKASRGATADALDSRAAHYLRNARCISERVIWRDGGRERGVSLTPVGECLLTHLEAEALPCCPHCGGTEIAFEAHTNEAGLRVLEGIPCPLCAPADDWPY